MKSPQKRMVVTFLVFLFGINFATSLSQTNLALNSENFIIKAELWLEADALFRKEPRWLGADDAYSIDLGSGRVLWLFADSFIATGTAGTRHKATMVRNSVAIQQGYDPSAASIKFYWGNKKRKPASFFPESRNLWYWPGHGIRIGKTLLIFLMQVRGSNTGLGFEVFGSQAIAIDNPDEEPSFWKVRWLHTPENALSIIIGSASVLQIGDYVYAFSAQEKPKGHAIYLVRWAVSKLMNNDLMQAEWWCGENEGWRALILERRKPVIVFPEGQTEFTVHFEQKIKRYVEIQTVGFGAASLALRWAENLTGQWSNLQKFYTPAEANREGVFIYAGKSHPELSGADLVLTYVVNHRDFGQLVDDLSLYYPRFLKGKLSRQQN